MKRPPSPFVWILDDDVYKSASYLPNKILDSTIQHLISCLISARYYYYGIRTSAIFKYKFSKENKDSTISELFPTGDVDEMLSLHKFSFSAYSNRTAKWCRKCREHYLYFQSYLRACLLEEEFRFGKIKKSHLIGSTLIDLNDGFEEQKIPLGKITGIIYEWKCLPVKYRKRIIVEGYRSLLISKMESPFEEYAGSKRDIPDFVMEKFNLEY